MAKRFGLFPVVALSLAVCMFGWGCSDEEAPVRLGFIGGISGGNADLGQAGRNGVMLAVEEANGKDGINGRKIELVIRDDANRAEQAIAAAMELVADDVEVIIGPFTTALTQAVQTVTEPKKKLVFSPTASAVEFAGKDDYLFRLCSTSTENAEDYAEFMAQRRGLRRIAVAVDQQNPVFVQSWMSAFTKKITPLGGKVVEEVWYSSQAQAGLADLVDTLLESEPDTILLLTNAVDAARITQQLRKADSETKVLVVEWAGTQQLIELGGKAVDGVEVLQIFDKFGKSENYLRFVDDYRRRFGGEPSFSSIIAYETASIVIDVMRKMKSGDDLKAAILANGPYEGLQQTLAIDRFGDTRRNSYFVAVRGSEFVPAP